MFFWLFWEICCQAYTCVWESFLPGPFRTRLFALNAFREVSSIWLFIEVLSRQPKDQEVEFTLIMSVEQFSVWLEESKIKSLEFMYGSRIVRTCFLLAGAHSSMEHHTSFHCCYEGQVPTWSDWCSRSYWLWWRIFLCEDSKQANSAEGIAPRLGWTWGNNWKVMWEKWSKYGAPGTENIRWA